MSQNFHFKPPKYSHNHFQCIQQFLNQDQVHYFYEILYFLTSQSCLAVAGFFSKNDYSLLLTFSEKLSSHKNRCL